MLELFINYITLIAFIALTLDLIFQISHVIKKKSSKDVSIAGCVVRIFAISILELKFILVNDSWLIVGQSIFGIVFLAYFALVLFYRNNSFNIK